MIWVILLYALFASVFTASKTGLEYAGPLFFIGFRMVVAGLLLLGHQILFNKNLLKQIKDNLGDFLLLAAFNIYLHNALEILGMQHLTSFKTCFIYSLCPFASAILSYYILKEKISQKKLVGLIIGSIGFLPILLQKSGPEEGIGHLFFLSWAEISVMGAAVASVYGWIILRRLMKQGVSPFLANGVSMLLGGICALLNSYTVESWSPTPVTEWIPFLKCNLFIIFVSSIICYNLSGYLLKRFTATFLSFAGFITPIFSALFGWWFLGEHVGMPFYLSTIGVFAGLIIFYQEELQEGYLAKT